MEEGLLEAPLSERLRLLDELADMYPEQVRMWVERHPRNLQVYMGWELEPFHDEAFDALLSNRQTLWLAPRGSGKSTSAAVILSAWLAVSRPALRDAAHRDLFPGAPRAIGPHNIRIALTSNSHEKAIGLHFQVKAILTSPRMTKLFGNLAGKRWRDEHSDTVLRSENLREATFTALGLGSKVTGGHYDFVVCDDWVVLENARTELQRQKIEDFWKLTVKPTHEPWARTAVCGTRYHPADWYGTIYDWWRTGRWECVLRHPAILTADDGSERSYWPAVWPLEKLYDVRDQVGSVAFSTQYQNEVDLLLGEFFEACWLERFERWEGVPERIRLRARSVLSLDPSIKGGESGDWAAFTLLSYTQPDFRVRRVWRGRWTQHELIDRVVRLWDEYRPESVPIEAVQGQEYLVQEVRRRTRVPAKAMLPRKVSKAGRAERVRTYFETGRVAFEPPTPDNGIQRLLDELLAFAPDARASSRQVDDCVDSLVWGMLELIRPRTRLRKIAR